MGLRYLPFSATGKVVETALGTGCQSRSDSTWLSALGMARALRRADREAVQGVVSGGALVASRLRPPDQFLSPCRP